MRRLTQALLVLFVILVIANFYTGDSQDAGTDAINTGIDPVSAQHYKALQSQSEAEQARLLRSVINSAGYPCRDVTTIQFNGSDSDGTGYWAAACSDGGNWMVQIENDTAGSTSVMPCEMLKALNVECWEKF